MQACASGLYLVVQVIADLVHDKKQLSKRAEFSDRRVKELEDTIQKKDEVPSYFNAHTATLLSQL